MLDSILCSLPSASTRKPLDAKCLPSLPCSGTFRPGSILAVDRPVSRFHTVTVLLPHGDRARTLAFLAAMASPALAVC